MSETAILMRQLADMDDVSRAAVLGQIEAELNIPAGDPTVTAKERLFASEYVYDFNCDSASQRMFMHRTAGSKMLQRPRVRAIVEALMRQHEAECKLNASYVRQFIHDVLEFCPAMCFEPGRRAGSWRLRAEEVQKLPPAVQRLIVSVSVVVDPQGTEWFDVKFVSKEKALELAARYTLIQKIEANISERPPWEQIGGAPSPDGGAGEIEARIADELAGGAQPQPV